MKYLLSIILLFLFSFTFAQNTLTATLNFPHQITENQDFSILLTIEKPENFCPYTLYTQNFPDGFFVETKFVSDAEISFQNQTLTITWVRLSFGKTLNIPLKISYIKGLNGTFSLSGKLIYLIDNQKGKYELKKHYISIIPKSKTNSSNLTEYRKNYETFQNIKCRRNVKLQKDYSYIIRININGLKNVNNFILTEEISQNFNISTTNTAKTKISQKNRIIQFTEKNNSKNETLVLEYRLIPKKKTEIPKPVIFGKLSFIRNNQIINIPIESPSQTLHF